MKSINWQKFSEMFNSHLFLPQPFLIQRGSVVYGLEDSGQTVWAQTLDPTTLGNFLTLSVPQFPYLYYKDNNPISLHRAKD